LFDTNSLDYTIRQSLAETGEYHHQRCSIFLTIGDARKTIKKLTKRVQFIFADGFSPDKNPELWSYDFIKILKSKLSNDGVILTYSAAYPIRGALLRAGLHVGYTPSFGRRQQGTIASLSQEKIELPLTEKDLNIILKSTAGLPYRDVPLNHNKKSIINQRAKTVQRLKQNGIPKWYK
jgi:hypothetical protein